MESELPGHSVAVTAAVHIAPPAQPPEFKALYDEHVDGVWRLLHRLGVPEAGLEDAVQEVFLIAHRQLPAFRGESSLKTWLGGIAVRIAKDVRRTFARKGSHEQPLETAARFLQAPESLEESVSQRQALTQVLMLLEQLDEDQRTVFVCAEFEEMTAPEISAATGVNLNTVYTRLRTARQHFNALVAKTGGTR